MLHGVSEHDNKNYSKISFIGEKDNHTLMDLLLPDHVGIEMLWIFMENTSDMVCEKQVEGLQGAQKVLALLTTFVFISI